MKLNAMKEQVATDNTGVFLDINDPFGDPYTAADEKTLCGFDIVGAQSDARKTQEEIEAKKLAKKGADQMTLADWRTRRINLAAACVVGLRGWETEDSTQDALAFIPFSTTNAKVVLQIDDRILAQLESGIARHTQLFLAASTN